MRSSPGVAVDQLDRKLLVLLEEDARLPMAELGRRIGLSRTATLARVRHLEAAGAIRGYHADVPDAVALSARVGIVIGTTDVAGYVRRLTDFRELREAETVAGDVDLLARFCAPDLQRLEEILDCINGWPETIRTVTYLVLTRHLGTAAHPIHASGPTNP